jgi:hypothetical protein
MQVVVVVVFVQEAQSELVDLVAALMVQQHLFHLLQPII